MKQSKQPLSTKERELKVMDRKAYWRLYSKGVELINAVQIIYLAQEITIAQINFTLNLGNLSFRKLNFLINL